MMWELTIEQVKKSEHSEFLYTVNVSFISNNLAKLTSLVDTMACFATDCETTYKIGKVGEQ